MATHDIPVIQRNVKPEVGSTPEFQSTVNALASSQNNLSAIGAKVAQVASNTMATQLGYEAGKNPQGDLTPSFTEFDKNFADSYQAQAQATLSTQADKLLTDAHIEMSKPNRLNPKLIANTTQQLQVGLNKIAENAPTPIRGRLQQSFDSQLLNQTAQYNQKMIAEQKEDEKNNLINAMDLSNKNALELYTKGDTKGGNLAAESAKRMADNLAANKYITPEAARVAKETATQSKLDGTYINKAMQADKEGKYAEFEKHYSENKPEGMTNEQYIATGRAFNSQIGFLQSLRQQDENLRSQQMLNRIAMNPAAITGVELKNFQDSVTPLQFEQVKFKYIQALKSNEASTGAADDLIRNFSNPEAWANSTEKNKNAAFNKQVDYAVQSTQNSATPITHEQAQVQVAASAGGEIPVFTNDLKNKIHSGNPAFIESAAQQIHSLKEMGAGQSLRGLNAEDNALYSLYERLRVKYPQDPVKAAHEATDIIHNQDPAVEQANKQKWSNFVSTKSAGVPLADFALSQVKLNKKDFGSVSMAQVYGTDILKEFEANFITTQGDQELALTLTKEFVDQNYGDTGVNGGRQKTLHPIEMMLGFKSHDGTPYIQQDIINQVNEKLLPIKEAYHSPKVPYNKEAKVYQSNEYWETVPLNKETHGLIRKTYDPIKIKRHIRQANGSEKTDTYNLILHGNNFDSYDVAILTKNGIRNIFQKAPYLGITTYTPNKQAILDSYSKANQFHDGTKNDKNPSIKNINPTRSTPSIKNINPTRSTPSISNINPTIEGKL
jgi:hypothetical protein